VQVEDSLDRIPNPARNLGGNPGIEGTALPRIDVLEPGLNHGLHYCRIIINPSIFETDFLESRDPSLDRFGLFIISGTLSVVK
jgi:hypothetical protein